MINKSNTHNLKRRLLQHTTNVDTITNTCILAIIAFTWVAVTVFVELPKGPHVVVQIDSGSDGSYRTLVVYKVFFVVVRSEDLNRV